MDTKRFALISLRFALPVAMGGACVANEQSVTATAGEGSGEGTAGTTEASGRDTEATAPSESTSVGPSSVGSGTEPGTDDGGTAPADPLCADFLGDPEPGPPLQFTLVNRGTTTIYVEWNGQPSLGVTTPNPNALYYGRTTYSCGGLMGVEPACVCCQGAVIPMALKLEAGDSYPVPWDGWVYELQRFADECLDPAYTDLWPCSFAPDDRSCDVPRRAPDGTYSVRSAAYPGVSAWDAVDGNVAPPDCEPAPCLIDNAGVDGDPVVVELSFDYPVDEVELAFP